MRFPDSPRKSALEKMCMTRWTQRICGWIKFCEVYEVLLETLEVIIGTRENPLPGEVKFDKPTTTRALSLLKSMEDSTFIVGLECINKFMTPILVPTRLLQQSTIEVLQAYTVVDNVIQVLQTQREEIEIVWEEDIWPQVVKKCGDLSIPLVIPRRCGRMTHKNNTPGDTPEEFFRRSVGVPLLDGIIEAMNRRFGPEQKRVSKLLILSPEILIKCDESELKSFPTKIPNHFLKVSPI